jgi:hypothetical protein
MTLRRTMLGRLAALTIGLTAPLIGVAQATAIPMPPPAPAGGVTYNITAHTADLNNAGTDGDVAIKLYGSQGISPWVWLDNSDDNWERNKTDRFARRLADVGTLRQLCVQFDRGDGRYADWYLDWFEVNGKFFEYYRWFTADAIVCRTAS